MAVAIASSTGGPRALAEVIPLIPSGLGLAVFVVQHMPKDFTRSLAQRLDLTSPMPVAEAVDNEPVAANRVYLAPGGMHMTVVKTPTGPVIRLDSGPPILGVRPAADPLFKSVASVFGAKTAGIILTGMGRDGADGLLRMRSRGAVTFAQDEASCVVYGMPREAALLGAAAYILPPSRIAARVAELQPAGGRR